MYTIPPLPPVQALKNGPGCQVRDSQKGAAEQGKLASGLRRREQVSADSVLHYFNPALVMKLIEIVQGDHTSRETADLLMEFSRRTGKNPYT
ncbi:MAG: hypothetical protein LBK40_06000 [Spirochaetaceae bacterium]|nr:hypothetical protein [Spirochaetaceae bacterium]